MQRATVVKSLLIVFFSMRLFEQSVAQPNTGVAVQSFVPSWVKDAIFYQIFPERFANGDLKNNPPKVEPWGALPKSKSYFGGDLQGIINKLDYIQSLGVNCLYLNPIFWSNSNHKYHAKDYLKIDPAFGDERVFKQLVDECHKRGIRIILDAVWNHSGTDFFAFEDVKKNGKKSKYLKWFNIYSFPVAPPSKPNYECWWNLGDLPKLMTHNPEVRDYLYSVTEKWMKFGIDGWRLDVPNEIPHPFWIEWRKLVKRLNPEAYIVGEIWDDASPWLKGDQFDAVMNYRFRKACLEFFVNGKTTPSEFGDSLLTTLRMYPEQTNYALQNLLGSHDTERFLTLCDGDKAKMKLAWLFQMTYLGAPMVYYGDEIGMLGGKDPDCRRTMIWEEAKQDQELLTTMKRLVQMRRSNPVFAAGKFATLKMDLRDVFAFERRDKNSIAVVVLNNGVKDVTVDGKTIMTESGFAWRQEFPDDLSMSAAGPLPPNLKLHMMVRKSGMVFLGERIR
jgi:cyclomaltodextrinase